MASFMAQRIVVERLVQWVSSADFRKTKQTKKPVEYRLAFAFFFIDKGRRIYAQPAGERFLRGMTCGRIKPNSKPKPATPPP